MSDKEVSKRLRKGSPDIFDYIMENYNKLLWVVIGNILEKVGSSEDIEDCISDVYIKLLENPKIYNPRKGSLKSFLVRVGKNVAIDRYRILTRSNVRAIHEHLGPDDNKADDPLQSIMKKENKGKVLNALDHLKEPDKEIIIRRYFYNEPVRIISGKMNLPTKKIENTLYQGKLKLKSILSKEEGWYEE